jgi:signal transduction histidine kinase
MRLRGKLLIPIAMGVSGLLMVQGWSLWAQRDAAVGQIAAAREAEVTVAEVLRAELALRGQVQEWKNVLLRGGNPVDFAKYHAQFLAREAEVRERTAIVMGRAPEQAQELGAFLADHDALGRKYREGLAALRPGDPDSVQAVDRSVRGLDRAPVARLEAVSQRLHQTALQASAQEQSKASATAWGLIAASLAIGLTMTAILWGAIRTFVAQPAERVAHLARELAAGRPPDGWKTSSDELGEVTTALRDLHEALVAEHDRLDARDQELAQSRREIAASTRAHDTFMAAVTHELRTPLHGVLGALDLLRESRLDPEQAELARVAHESGTKLAAMVEELLDITEASGGNLTLEDASFEVVACLKEAVDQHRRAATHKGITLTFQAVGGPRHVRGDGQRLAQVLAELVENAVTATDRGQVGVVARIVDEGHRARLRVDVVDTGKGVDPTRRERLFQAFTGEEGPYARGGTGPGLGLAWCRQVVRTMGGELDLEPQTGGGSRFWFEVRLGEGAVAGEADPATMSHLSVISHPGSRILIVDPEAERGTRLVASLSAHGEAAWQVADLVAATHVLLHEPIALVLIVCDADRADVACDALRSAADAAGRLPGLLALVPEGQARDPWALAGFDDTVPLYASNAALRVTLDRWLPRRAA